MKHKAFFLILAAILFHTLPVTAQLPAGIPHTAKLADEDFSIAIYLNIDRKNNQDEFALDCVSVWLYDKSTNKSRKLFQCNPDADYDISQLRTIKTRDIPYIDFVKIWPDTETKKLIVCGTLPDFHNISTSIVDIEKNKAVMLPCGSGFVAFDPEEGNVLVASYAYYEEGGRYAIIKAFDEHGRQLGSMSLKKQEKE